jgi:hypothetical protein
MLRRAQPFGFEHEEIPIKSQRSRLGYDCLPFEKIFLESSDWLLPSEGILLLQTVCTDRRIDSFLEAISASELAKLALETTKYRYRSTRLSNEDVEILFSPDRSPSRQDQGLESEDRPLSDMFGYSTGPGIRSMT